MKAIPAPTPAPSPPASIFAALAAPFPPEKVSWRVGSTTRKAYEAKRTDKRRGKPLCYIDARDVMDRFDAVMGAHWQTDSIPMHNASVCCRIGLLIEGDWLWRCDGAGATEVEGAKGAYSDALKRAAVLWGVGRYLYGVDAPWIDLDEWWGIPKDAYSNLTALLAGKSVAVKSAYAARREGHFPRVEKRLRTARTVKALAKVWTDERAVIAVWPEEWQRLITDEKNRAKAALQAKAWPAANGSMQAFADSLARLEEAQT